MLANAQRSKKTRHSKGAGVVRLIGGQWRRRLLHFPLVEGLRPTADAVRERLFNWLGQDVHGWRCLDLFSGSGALGFEAASRGAAQVLLLESNRTACAALEANRQMLGAQRVQVLCTDVRQWLQQFHPEPDFPGFDLVLLDPPFALHVQESVLEMLPRLLADSAAVYVEHDGTLTLPQGWSAWREGRSGRAHYCILKREPV